MGLHVAAALTLLVWIGIADGAPSPCDVRHPGDALLEWTCHTLRRGETLEGMFGEAWADVARFNRIDRRHAVAGVRIRVPRDLSAIECYTPMPGRYEPAAADAQFVLVDLAEQFLAAYEYGERVFSAPITAGRPEETTPTGRFRFTAFDREHESSLYRVPGSRRPYPMHFGLRFHVDRNGVSYWIHGRDLPGSPASHGCVGLYDEAMQNECYGTPRQPALADARWLFEWVVGADTATAGAIAGPPLLILGDTTAASRPAAASREVGASR